MKNSENNVKKAPLLTTLLVVGVGFIEPMAFAGGADGGGGSSIAYEVQSAARSAFYESELQPQLNLLLGDLNWRPLILEPKIVITEKPLFVRINGQRQPSTMTNHRKSNTIKVNRIAWESITDSCRRQALAMHEYLSLDGKESTGVYGISGQYQDFCESAGPAQSLQSFVETMERIGVYRTSGRRPESYPPGLTGRSLYNAETNRIEEFKYYREALYLNLSPATQFDVLITGTISYSFAGKNGGGSKTMGNPALTASQQLSHLAYRYLETLKSYIEHTQSTKNSSAQKSLIDRLLNSINQLISFYAERYSSPDGKISYIRFVSPESQYSAAFIDHLRQTVEAKKCAYPIYQQSGFAGRSAKENFAESIAKPPVNLPAEAELLARKVAAVDGLTEEIEKLLQAFENNFPVLDEDKRRWVTFENIESYFSVSRLYIREIRYLHDRYRTGDVDMLKNIRKLILSDRLCFPRPTD